MPWMSLWERILSKTRADAGEYGFYGAETCDERDLLLQNETGLRGGFSGYPSRWRKDAGAGLRVVERCNGESP